LIWAACARQSSPSGGAKDEKPPIVTEAHPGQESVNFSSDKIVLEFSEYVRLNNIQNELIVSPYLEEKPDVYLKGKKVVVKLSEALKKNTTYSFNFGNAIGDNTENNLAENLTYVFSTGTFIDSLTISGKVIDATNGQAVKEAYVFLYESTQDSLIFKQQPDYLCKTNENGFFEFMHLPQKTFQLAALNNSNNNFIYDNEKEQLAFYSEFIYPEDSLRFSNRLLLYQPVLSKQWQIEIPKDTGLFKLFVQNIDSPVLRVISDSTKLYHYSYNYTQDSIEVFYSSSKSQAQFAFFDTDSLLDTIRIKQTKADSLPNTFKFQSWGTAKNQFNLLIDRPFQLASKYPIQVLDTSRFEVKEDSIKMKELTFSINPDNPRLIDIQGSWLAESTYQFVVKDSAVATIFDQTNLVDTLLLSPTSYTQIELNLTNADSLNRYVAELYEGNNKFLMAQNLDSLQTTFNKVLPGNYSIKVIEDLNGNGKWDTGIYGYVQPEQIFITGETPFKVKQGLGHSISLNINP